MSHITVDTTFSSAISASDTDILMQGVFTGNNNDTTEQNLSLDRSLSTVTSTPSCNQSKSTVAMEDEESPDSKIISNNNDDGRDWSLPVSKFLEGFRAQAAASLANAYRAQHPLHRSANTGAVTTSLAEDIFFLVDVQLNVLHDFLEDASILNTDDGEDVIEDALLAIFRCIWAQQTRHRETFLESFEMCCATANDFFRMMTRIEELMGILELKYPFLEWNSLDGDTKTEVIRREANDLATLFVSDSVYAAQRAHLFVMRSLRLSSIPTELFGRDWEDRFTHNEIIISVIREFEDFNNDLQNYLCNEYLYHKVVVSLVRATVAFYLQLLLRKAERVRQRKSKKLASKFKTDEEQLLQMPFICPTRALCRMMHDIKILQDYFQKISKSAPTLSRVINKEMHILTVVHEYLGLAGGNTGLDSLEEFIVVLHKRTGANVDVTHHFLTDLWLLATSPAKNQTDRISMTVSLMRAELEMVSERMSENTKKLSSSSAQAKELPPRLEEVLQSHYEDRIWQEKLAGCGGCLKQR